MFIAFLLNVATVQAADPKKKKGDNKETVKAEKQMQKLSDTEIQALVARINEIKQMDVKALPAKQKRELRREVRNIKDNLKQNAEGFSIYIGGGAVLIIIILLILLL
jgi:seryl-tRNA synthetase